MILITQRGKIKDVVKNWERQYPPKTTEPDKAEIGQKLRKLNLDKAMIHDVEKIIGNYSWTRLRCDECNREDDELLSVVQVGTVNMCKECAKRALALFTYG